MSKTGKDWTIKQGGVLSLGEDKGLQPNLSHSWARPSTSRHFSDNKNSPFSDNKNNDLLQDRDSNAI